VCARRVGRRIRYRVVDEYAGENLEGKTQRDSMKPLTRGELFPSVKARSLRGGQSAGRPRAFGPFHPTEGSFRSNRRKERICSYPFVRACSGKGVIFGHDLSNGADPSRAKGDDLNRR
jgi:hypothetical protein